MRSSLDGDDFSKPCTLRASTDCIQELCRNIISAIKGGTGRAVLHCFLARLRAVAPAGGTGRHRDMARRRGRRRTRRRRAARAADRPRPQVQASTASSGPWRLHGQVPRQVPHYTLDYRSGQNWRAAASPMVRSFPTHGQRCQGHAFGCHASHPVLFALNPEYSQNDVLVMT